MANFVDVLNAIRGVASASYQDRVPVATQNNIDAVGNPILEYQSIQNEFCNLLVNKIAFSIVTSRVAQNKLASLKKGSVPLGSDIEDIYVNMAKAETFDPDGKTLLQRKLPDVKAAYYRMNIQNKYKASISQAQLQLAFTSYAELEKLVNGIVNSLYSGANYDEFVMMKGLIEGAVNNKLIGTKVITAVTDKDTADNFVETLRADSMILEFPSSDYNQYLTYATKQGVPNPTAVVTWTPLENQVLLIRSDYLAKMNVRSMAAAFHLDMVDFLAKKVITVDKFDDAGHMVAVLCDEALFQCYENLSQMREFVNGEGLYTNYIWHRWYTMAVQPFANAICYVTTDIPGTEVEPETITLTTPSSLTMMTGDTSNIGITFTPDTAAVDRNVTYTSSAKNIARVSKGGRITALAEGSATITIKSTADDSVTATVSVTVADPE